MFHWIVSIVSLLGSNVEGGDEEGEDVDDEGAEGEGRSTNMGLHLHIEESDDGQGA